MSSTYIFNQKTEKRRWAGNDSHVAFGRKFPGEKGSVKWCVASSFVVEVQGEIFAHFYAVTINCRSSMQN
jgi:hypothetical protein